MKNTIKRTISGVGFIAVMVGALLWCEYSFAVLMLIIMSMMMFEFYRMTMDGCYKFSQILAIMAGAILFILTFLAKRFEAVPGKMVMLAFIPVFIVMINSLYVKDKTEFGKFANIYTALLYIAIPWSITNFAALDSHGGYTGLPMICFFAIVWASDVGAYIFGMALGQRFGRKLCPEISPKKSWIGFWGGMACAIAAAIGLHYVGWLEAKLWQCAVLAVVMDVAGVYGDIIESQWKRHYTIKDSGKAIPGHGGFLDRFDSALLAIPIGIIMLELLNIL